MSASKSNRDARAADPKNRKGKNPADTKKADAEAKAAAKGKPDVRAIAVRVDPEDDEHQELLRGVGDDEPDEGVRKVQGMLQKVGHAPGAADGRYGPMTQRAVSAFQREHDLDPSGRVDAPTSARLQAENDRVERADGYQASGDARTKQADRKGKLKEATADAAERKRLARQGLAMADGSLPIRDARELAEAKRALIAAAPDQRAGVMAHIRKRAIALGLREAAWDEVFGGLYRDALAATDLEEARRTGDEMTLLEVGETHEKTIGSGDHGLWGMKGKQLPGVMQHVFNDLVQSGHQAGSETYRLAVGIVENWSHGKGAKDPAVIAKATKAVAEWEKLRAERHARSAKGLAESLAGSR